jgi:hypothetical protein
VCEGSLHDVVAVAAVLGILAWVGYALATTPPPKPIEEIEKEVQKALEEIEKTTQHKPHPPSAAENSREKQGEERRGRQRQPPISTPQHHRDNSHHRRRGENPQTDLRNAHDSWPPP